MLGIKFYYQDFLLVIVSLFSITLYLTAIYNVGVFKLATGTVIGIIINEPIISLGLFDLDNKDIINP